MCQAFGALGSCSGGGNEPRRVAVSSSSGRSDATHRGHLRATARGRRGPDGVDLHGPPRRGGDGQRRQGVSGPAVRRRLGGHHLAHRVRRARVDYPRTGRVQRDCRRVRGADGSGPPWVSACAVRQSLPTAPTTTGTATSARCFGAPRFGANSSPSRARAPTSPPAKLERSGSGPSTWSTVRRCGHRGLTTPTSGSCWHGLNHRNRSIVVCRCSSWTCVPQGSRADPSVR